MVKSYLLVIPQAAEFIQELSDKRDIQPTDKCLKLALLLSKGYSIKNTGGMTATSSVLL